MTGPLRDFLDSIINAQKEMAGEPEWKEGPRYDSEGQSRYVQTLGINGEICPVKLIVDSYPSPFGQKFSIALVMDVEIVRLDYGKYVAHVNHEPLPDGVPFGLINGPHIHGWDVNRHLFTSSEPPKELKYAKLLPANVQGFQNAFREFCGINNVVCGFEIPDLPLGLLL